MDVPPRSVNRALALAHAGQLRSGDRQGGCSGIVMLPCFALRPGLPVTPLRLHPHREHQELLRRLRAEFASAWFVFRHWTPCSLIEELAELPRSGLMLAVTRTTGRGREPSARAWPASSSPISPRSARLVSGSSGRWRPSWRPGSSGGAAGRDRHLDGRAGRSTNGYRPGRRARAVSSSVPSHHAATAAS